MSRASLAPVAYSHVASRAGRVSRARLVSQRYALFLVRVTELYINGTCVILTSLRTNMQYPLSRFLKYSLFSCSTRCTASIV